MMPASWVPDTSLFWYDQVLDLERKGKPTTIAAHDIAVEAKARSEIGRAERQPGSDDE
jgi:hypothetical protein